MHFEERLCRNSAQLIGGKDSVGNFDGIRERYSDKRISSEVLSLIGQMAGSTELIEMGKSMEVTNMCTALERLKAEGIEQGMEKGIEKTVISMLKKNYLISEICEITGKTEEEILKIKKTLQCMGDIKRYLLFLLCRNSAQFYLNGI